MSFIYRAKPRYTKDMNVWVDPDPENIKRANEALKQFPSPDLLSANPDEILQLAIAPNRVDLYGATTCNWVDLDTLLAIKSAIDHPRHQEDARVLREVKKLREQRQDGGE